LGLVKSVDTFAFACAFAGDLLTYLNVWHAWEEHHRSSKWAHRNCLNQQALLRAADIRVQLFAMLHRLHVPVVSCDGDMPAVTKVCELPKSGNFLLRVLLIMIMLTCAQELVAHSRSHNTSVW
jgi:hypothetical protein